MMSFRRRPKGFQLPPTLIVQTTLCRLMKLQLEHNKTNAARIRYHMANPKSEVNTKTHLLFPDVRYPYV